MACKGHQNYSIDWNFSQKVWAFLTRDFLTRLIIGLAITPQWIHILQIHFKSFESLSKRFHFDAGDALHNNFLETLKSTHL